MNKGSLNVLGNLWKGGNRGDLPSGAKNAIENTGIAGAPQGMAPISAKRLCTREPNYILHDRGCIVKSLQHANEKHADRPILMEPPPRGGT